MRSGDDARGGATGDGSVPTASPLPARPEAKPPAAPWLDTAAGLARTGADPALYRRLLQAFRDGHRDDPRRLRQAIAAADAAAATRIAHGLKGVAGMLGADPLHEAAVAAMAVRERPGPAPEPAALRQLVHVLAAVLAAVEAELGDEAAGSGGGGHHPPGTVQPMVATGRTGHVLVGRPLTARGVQITYAER
jgi:HPt (histidine-containing phosphotransfer) domain-containing protein